MISHTLSALPRERIFPDYLRPDRKSRWYAAPAAWYRKAEMTHLTRIVALVGMMGAGKSALGRRLATRLDVPFRDTDAEIVKAAGCGIPEIFSRYGEAAFRDCERKVVSRLLEDPPHVLATGGGAFMDADLRERIRQCAVSVWITAPVEVLLERVKRKDDRPLLKSGDPREVLERLLQERGPVYATADITVTSDDIPHTETVERMLAELTARGICEEP
jgi:shikimate kinase